MLAQLFVNNLDKMKNKITLVLAVMLFFSTSIKAQVPVREEPRHHPVLQNKYFRLLDVWLPPGDTSLFHIHAIPSLFIILSNTFTGSQIKGRDWAKSKDTAGKTWYRSFYPDILIHRVANFDTVPLHVNDIEILSLYDSNHVTQRKPLPFPLLFENEKAFAYRLTKSNFNSQIIKNRGPLIAELVSGDGVIFNDAVSKQSIKIKAGKYLYIEPGASFNFASPGTGKNKMVLFEIK
jgi:hypothetical protein